MHSIRYAYGNGLRQDIWAEFQQRFKIPQIIEFYGATESPVAFINVSNKVGACGRCSPVLVSGMVITVADLEGVQVVRP